MKISVMKLGFSSASIPTAVVIATLTCLQVNAADDDAAATDRPWWHAQLSLAFDGHGNFVTPHLETLNATVASLGAAGFNGPWDADLNRDMPWIRSHEKAFAEYPGIKQLVYIEGAEATKVLTRVAADGRVLFTEGVLAGFGDPQRRLPWRGG